MIMKLPDPSFFNYKECNLLGDDCYLIIPSDIGVKWTDENARFRSCLIRKSDSHVISQGFTKFTNFGEQPAFQPWRKDWPVKAHHKIDGSLLIFSSYKGKRIVRTRGTIDARSLDNGHEIDFLSKKYPHIFDMIDVEYSYLCEWTTPSNVIVLRESQEPELTLLGIVDNATAQYVSPITVDRMAKTLNMKRPKEFEFDSIESCILDVSLWKGKEGVVVHSPDGQTLKKIKSAEYCELHKLATGMRSINNVLDVFIESPRFFTAKEFYDYVAATLDFEIAEKIKPEIERVVNCYLSFLKKKDAVELLVGEIRSLDNRKKQAMFVISEFPTGWQKGYAFSLLDGKEIDENKLIRDEISYW